MDALLKMRVAEVGPLGGELGIRPQQRHKVGREGRVPPAGLGANDAVGRDIHQAQRLLRHNIHVDQYIIQHREIGRLAARHTGAVGLLAGTQRVPVILLH